MSVFFPRNDSQNAPQVPPGSVDIQSVDELTREFVAESREGLDRMERCLTELEGHPENRSLVDEIFRAVHTMKGATGFLGFVRLEALAHAGETLLSSLRAGKVIVTGELISGLLELLDSLRSVLRLVELTGGEGQRRTDEDFATIGRLLELNETGIVSAALARMVAASDLHHAPLPSAPEAGPAELSSEAADAVERRVSVQPIDRTLRVDAEVLNRLMNQVGELVVTRNQLLRLATPDAQLGDLARRLDLVTSDLRETVMHLRLQPIGHLFGKFPRVVRDIARACGKQVRLEIEGQDTGLDKSLLEAIRDPLTHALRNSIDHGIEAPRDRLLAGKAAEGVVRLRAFQQNGCVVVELRDDGAGICSEKVAFKAIERGLISPARAAAMSDRERIQLVFAPGLSTAAEVTNLSGRGVGMDVVRANVEKVGGSVQLESVPGVGTTVRLTLPFTLAILPAVVVRSAGQSFALPQSALLELVHIPACSLDRSLVRIGGSEFYVARQGLFPVLRLAALMNLEEAGCAASDHHVALVESEGCRFGVFFDDVIAPEEIVVKPISAVLRECGLFSGAASLGCGELALVLDVPGLRTRAGLQPNSDAPCTRSQDEPAPHSPADPVLVYEVRSRDGITPETRFIPLSFLDRIETVPSHRIERISGRTVLRIGRDLIEITGDGCALAKNFPDEVTALLCQHDGRRHAILAERVLNLCEHPDLCEQPVSVPSTSGRLALVDDRIAIPEEFASVQTAAEVA